MAARRNRVEDLKVSDDLLARTEQIAMCWSDCLDLFQSAISQGANVDTRSDRQRTTLMIASEKGNLAVVEVGRDNFVRTIE